MKYYIDGKPIDIPTDKNCFNSGSEGEIFVIKDKAYKIYYPNAIKNMDNTIIICHKEMTKIKTQQIILPSNLIYDTTNTFCGYVNPLIPGNPDDKTGIIKMPSKMFVRNLKILEKDSTILGENLILMEDLYYDNYQYDRETETMYLLDPSRYTREANLEKLDCIRKNIKCLNILIEELLYLDFKKYKPVKTFSPRRKAKYLITRIKDKKKDQLYSEFFEKELENRENVYKYVKSL